MVNLEKNYGIMFYDNYSLITKFMGDKKASDIRHKSIAMLILYSRKNHSNNIKVSKGIKN